MEWIQTKDKMPNEGEFIISVRTYWPSYFWMGKYTSAKISIDSTDEFDVWLPLPDLPKRRD